IRGRIVFFLVYHRGVCVGLAGRILPSVEEKLSKNLSIGKYVNSPETPIYHKSKTLYGLSVTKLDIKKAKSALIVEGEVDFLSVWQAGFKNIVAIKGTALTEEQIKILSRFTNKLILALDSDIAGDQAARRGISIAQNLGMKVEVLKPSKKFKDPDEFVNSDLEGFKKQILNAENVWDFIIDSIFTKYDDKSGEGKAQISREIVPILASIDDNIVQSHYIGKIAKRLEVPIEAVTKEIAKVLPNRPQAAQVNVPAPLENKNQEKQDRLDILEEKLISLSFETNPRVILENKDLFDKHFSKIIIECLEKFGVKREFNLKEFVTTLPSEVSIKFSSLILVVNKEFEDNEEAIKREIDMVIQELKITTLKNRKNELIRQISAAENAENEKLTNELSKEFTRISQNLANLESNS
ncbi:toprim domain-containing protein, partial [Candidatus Microgenomates bacterium]|nr:toprim domain-containing protein [Candidatus Microgenomates bacterium]